MKDVLRIMCVPMSMVISGTAVKSKTFNGLIDTVYRKMMSQWKF